MTTRDARKLLADLVAFPTVSSSSNLNCVRYIREHLESFVTSCQVLHDETGTSASLVATIGPAVEGETALSGHTDVVPVDGQAWTRDPWRLTESGGRLYGRGTTDMKGLLAAMMSVAPDAAAPDLRRPLHLAFSYDEETGCQGA